MNLDVNIEAIVKNLRVSRQHILNKDFTVLKEEIYQLIENIENLRAVARKEKESRLLEILYDTNVAQILSFAMQEIVHNEVSEVNQNKDFYFEVYHLELEPFLVILETKLQEFFKPSFPPGGITVSYASTYKDVLNNPAYRSNANLIRKIEEKIKAYFEANGKPGLPGIAGYIKRTGDLHADLPMPLGNHRIVYQFDPKKRQILFTHIVTHLELDRYKPYSSAAEK